MTDKQFDTRPKTKWSEVKTHVRRVAGKETVVRRHTRNVSKPGWGFTEKIKPSKSESFKPFNYTVTLDDRMDQVVYSTALNHEDIAIQYLSNMTYHIEPITSDLSRVHVGFNIAGQQRDHKWLGYNLGMVDIEMLRVFGKHQNLEDFHFSRRGAELTYLVRKPGVSETKFKQSMYPKPERYRMVNRPTQLDIFKVREAAEKTYGKPVTH